MGVLTGFREPDIIEMFEHRHIDTYGTYVVALRHNTVVEGLLKWLLTNGYYIFDSAILRIIAACNEGLIIVNPTWQFTGNLKDLGDHRFQIFPWSKLRDVSFTPELGNIVFRFSDDNSRRQKWRINVTSPGVFKFNPKNLHNLKKAISERE